ncbi:MAG: biotin/lipoyl-binding protein, partial [Ignavibacteriales bacterium]|nr:biotin/lipoyl-binding protein [Ignavibacteriales bacterium]
MGKPLFRLIPILIILQGCGDNNSATISASGTIEATEVTVSAQVGGIVRQFRADEGSAVNAGDTLAILDATDWMHQLRQAEANFSASDAQYKLAVRGARQEDLIQAEANFQSAESDLKRMQELAPTGSISPKQLEDTK